MYGKCNFSLGYGRISDKWGGNSTYRVTGGLRKNKSCKTYPVRCSDGMSFDSYADASEFYGIPVSYISKSVAKGCTTAKLRFYAIGEAKKLCTKVKCVESGIIYESMASAESVLDIKRGGILNAMQKKRAVKSLHFVRVV